jgi:hypothetical protein
MLERARSNPEYSVLFMAADEAFERAEREADFRSSYASFVEGHRHLHQVLRLERERAEREWLRAVGELALANHAAGRRS